MEALEIVSMNKQKPSLNRSFIGRGRLAEVFTWGNNLAIKLFYKGSLKSIKQEAHICRLVYETGLPIPAVKNIVEVDGR